MLYYLLALIHVAVSVALIFFVLVQSNKGMGLSGAFGSMGAGENIFSSSGGMNLMIKITIGLCIFFVLTTLSLGIFPPSVQTGGIMDNAASNQPQAISDLINQSQATDANAEAPIPAEGNAAPEAK
jgi:preprotein translocase subunit SecG